MTSDGVARSGIRGLSTVALLKVNYDAGRDHISMFQPFVTDTLSHALSDAFTVEQARLEIVNRHDLLLPANTLRTLLGREVKRGYLVREGGRFLRTKRDIPGGNLSILRA